MPVPVYKSTSTAKQLRVRGGESNGQIKASEIVPLRALRDEPDLIAAIQRDIKGLGVVGEAIAALLLYLVGTSRLLASPMRAIFRGPSGSGKSEIQQRVASMFPVEDVIEATSLTTNALYYMDEGELENKFIVKGERSHRRDDDQADVTAALRQLISEGRIVKLVTAMVDGQLSTKKITQNGPIAFCETTTQEKLLSEDVNRCLMIRTDDSEPQTAKVMEATAQAFLLGPIARDPQAIIDRHREFQSSLESRSVVVPYAVDLAKLIPSGKVEARRVIKQVLGCIEAIAFLHQHHRKLNDDGQLEATQNDYRLARRLLLQPLQESLGCGSRLHDAYKTLKANFPRGEFDSTAVLDAGCFNTKPPRDKALKELVKLGVLENVAKGKGGKPARWKWTDKTLEQILPTAKTLFRKVVK